jgi:hypothetical protein
MMIENQFRRNLIAGDLVCHYDTGHIGVLLESEANDFHENVSVFMLQKVMRLSRAALYRISDVNLQFFKGW